MSIQINEPQFLFLKLKIGDDIISEALYVGADDFDRAHYILNKPLKMIYSVDRFGNVSLSYILWILESLCPEQQFKVYEEEIVTTQKPAPDIEKFYIKCTSEKENIIRPEEQESEGQIDNNRFVHASHDDDAFIKEKEDKALWDAHKEMNREAMKFYKNNKKSYN
jgi:hypothetical protein